MIFILDVNICLADLHPGQ
jgi:hypothetical protein